MRNAVAALGIFLVLVGLNVWSSPGGSPGGLWVVIGGALLVLHAAQNGKDW